MDKRQQELLDTITNILEAEELSSASKSSQTEIDIYNTIKECNSIKQLRRWHQTINNQIEHINKEKEQRFKELNYVFDFNEYYD